MWRLQRSWPGSRPQARFPVLVRSRVTAAGGAAVMTPSNHAEIATSGTRSKKDCRTNVIVPDVYSRPDTAGEWLAARADQSLGDC